MKQRQSLQETINANGGTYHPNLSRSSTHLIAKATEGAKYERAKAWGLKIVSIKWLQDCLERGMVLDESKYNPLIPVEQQGDRFLKALPKTVIGSKRSRDSDTDKVSGQDEQGKRKLRRTASTRLSSHSQNMWADIAEPSVVAKSEGNNQWNEAEDESSKSNPAEKAPEAVKDTRTSDVGVKARPELPESLFTRWACLVFGHKEQMVRQYLPLPAFCRLIAVRSREYGNFFSITAHKWWIASKSSTLSLPKQSPQKLLLTRRDCGLPLSFRDLGQPKTLHQCLAQHHQPHESQSGGWNDAYTTKLV